VILTLVSKKIVCSQINGRRGFANKRNIQERQILVREPSFDSLFNTVEGVPTQQQQPSVEQTPSENVEKLSVENAEITVDDSPPPSTEEPAVAVTDTPDTQGHAEQGESLKPSGPPPTPASAEITTELLSSMVSLVSLPPEQLAGAHATQVHSSPEDMEFNRIKTTYANMNGDFAPEALASSILSATPALEKTSLLFSSSVAAAASIEPSDQGFEVVDGTTIFFNAQPPSDGEDVSSKVDEEIRPSMTAATDLNIVVTQSQDQLEGGKTEELPNIDDNVIQPSSSLEHQASASVVDSEQRATPEVEKTPPQAFNEAPSTPPPSNSNAPSVAPPVIEAAASNLDSQPKTETVELTINQPSVEETKMDEVQDQIKVDEHPEVIDEEQEFIKEEFAESEKAIEVDEKKESVEGNVAKEEDENPETEENREAGRLSNEERKRIIQEELLKSQNLQNEKLVKETEEVVHELKLEFNKEKKIENIETKDANSDHQANEENSVSHETTAETTSTEPVKINSEEIGTTLTPDFRNPDESVSTSAPEAQNTEESVSTSAPDVQNSDKIVTTVAPEVQNSDEIVTTVAPEAQNSDEIVTTVSPEVQNSEEVITTQAPYVQNSEEIVSTSAPEVSKVEHEREEIKNDSENILEASKVVEEEQQKAEEKVAEPNTDESASVQQETTEASVITPTEEEVVTVKEEELVVSTESPGFFGSFFGSSETETTLQPDLAIPPVTQMTPTSLDEPLPDLILQPVTDVPPTFEESLSFNSDNEIKFYEPGQAPEHFGSNFEEFSRSVTTEIPQQNLDHEQGKMRRI